MVIIALKGGLGNQMFQYALYLKMKQLGKNVKLDVSQINKNTTGRIDQFFDIDLSIASSKENLMVKKVNSLFYIRGFHKICKLFNIKENIYVDSEEEAQLKIFELDNIYLDGYWQSEKYFADIEKNIKRTFVMKNNLTSYQKNILSKIKATESVSVHIRRGDYLNLIELYGNICTLEYYKRAFDYFRYKPVHFFIFSNDYEYARINFSGTNITVIKPELDNFSTNNMDLFLMSSCKYNIIANSTFSWWGGWLNQNPQKIVIAPEPWMNTRKLEDIYCKNWIRISSNY